MVDQTEFEHITVTASEDEDIVVFAGAHEEPGFSESTGTAAPETGESVRSVSEPVQKPGNQKKQASGYHPTTLEDINSSKMSLTQKIVIALAFVAIAAFAIWYLFLQGGAK